MCPAGYTGKNCESKYVPCSPSPCQNGGTCRSTGLTYECKCPEGKCCPCVAMWRNVKHLTVAICLFIGKKKNKKEQQQLLQKKKNMKR